MRQHSRRSWTAPAKHKPRDPPKGDVNAIPWVPKAARPLVLLNGKVVDVGANKIHEDMTVVIEDGHFTAVKSGAKVVKAGSEDVKSEEGGEVLEVPANSRIVDVDGLYICPGLVDCHVHINFSDGRPVPYVDHHLRASYTLKCMLARGFTTVRDVGGATFFQKQAIEQWLTPGPRLFQGGELMSQTGGHGDLRARQAPSHSLCCAPDIDFCVLADGVPGVTLAARELMRKGADHVKICTSGGVSSPTDKLEGVQFSPEEIRAIVAYTNAAIRRAVENGVRGIEHGNLLDRETARLLAETGTFLTPTLMISTAKGRPPWNATLPDYMREKNAKVRDAGRRAIQIADEEGVCICFGTDLTMGMGYLQSEEFTQRHALLPSHRILAHATINGAKQLNDPKIGRVEQGAYGDCLILNGNPLEDCRILDSGPKGIWGVVKEGRVVVARSEFMTKIKKVGGLDVVLGVDEAL